MIILNATIGFSFKALTVYGPIYDLININKIKSDLFYLSPLEYSMFCLDDPTCNFIDNIANFLNLFPLSILLIFYSNFDKKFNLALKELFVINKKTTKTTKNVSSVLIKIWVLLIMLSNSLWFNSKFPKTNCYSLA